MTTVICKPDSRNFAYGVKSAKGLGGKFDPTTKTWAISYNEQTREFTPSRHGLVEVRRIGSAAEALEQLGAEAAMGDSGMDNLG